MKAHKTLAGIAVLAVALSGYKLAQPAPAAHKAPVKAVVATPSPSATPSATPSTKPVSKVSPSPSPVYGCCTVTATVKPTCTNDPASCKAK